MSDAGCAESDTPPARQRIAVFDMSVATGSPAGSCVLAEVQGLAKRFDVTVFSDRFDRGAMGMVDFIRVRAPRRPVLLRYLVFHLFAPWHYLVWRLRVGRPDWVQATQGQLPGADICYAHFCHSAYLQTQWSQVTATGTRRWARWVAHAFNAWCETRAFAKAKVIVVPSVGLRAEIASRHAAYAHKLHVISNPVDTGHFHRPAAFDREQERRARGFESSHVVLCFMALGDFDRKGLGLLLNALEGASEAVRARVRILVVGGQAGEVAQYSAIAHTLSLQGSVTFVGMQTDVRPHLWASDAFTFPSAYEIFSLAILQAAAAGLATLVSQGLYGADEFVVDGHNGWVVPRNVAAIRAWLERLPADPVHLRPLGDAATAAVQAYGVGTFRERWVALFNTLGANAMRGAAAATAADRAAEQA